MAQRTQAGRLRGIVAQALGHQRGGAGHPFGLPYVHMQQTHHLVVEASYCRRHPEFRAGLQQLAAALRVRLLRQFQCELI
jgi:hypothetical protein